MILWCIKLILYRLSNRGLQAAVLQRGAGTHCHTAAAVTTCHVSHVSTYPMVAWAGHRSGHAEKLQLWRILSGLAHSVTRCCHVCACGQLVTCHVSPWRGWSSITVSSPGHPRSCWHMWSLARLEAAPCAVSPPGLLTPLRCWRGWDRSAGGCGCCLCVAARVPSGGCELRYW